MSIVLYSDDVDIYTAFLISYYFIIFLRIHYELRMNKHLLGPWQ
jgi:hypothetical protein